MIPSQRALFDIPGDVAYLNCAYMSPLSHAVAEAGRHAIAAKARPWNTVSKDFFTLPAETRDLAGQVMGVPPNEIAIIPSVSYAVATAARNLDLDAGDEILVLKDDFPSDVYGWRRLAEERSLSIRTVERAAGNDGNWTDAVLEALSSKTRLLSLPHIHWTDGIALDLERIATVARREGIGLFLDLTQSLGVLPIDLQKIDPDFAVAATYKWLLGPYGLGLLRVAPRHHQGRPLEEGWIVRERADNFATLIDYQDDYQAGAVRFDMGERSQFQLLPMANAGLRHLLDWGIAEIAETLAERTRMLATELAPLGITCPPAHVRAPHYLGARLPGSPPQGLLEKLARNSVFISQRGENLRITPHVYNTDEDCERLIRALRAYL